MSQRQMVMNYVPGEECRVAIVEDKKLDEFHAERMDGPSSHVGNIYVGKVVNVEPAIQAAFIDFGLEANGFLHVSDVHPQYFPGEDNEKTERVGKKTPRRERPPIQDCFRRGDEVAVQVLKEGVGTKGPTVTSYLSIPGRFLVMMPQMDKVGVSRKVEDEDTRRKMREILDQLDLPDGFGFILRTAGMERNKAELKRDLAYLMRLWKDMEKRWRSGNKPRLLYSESDLLVRALRDLLTTDIDQIVVDNQAALNRAARFLKIVAPRTTTKLVHFTGRTPIFHAMGIEPQIQMIHAREVPLPSGGRLVIDEAEALVAIDVNSGKSRDARDSETNAYQTNVEAVDEICRQLKLRDLGGVIVNDLIDMRSVKHRREIENRFRDNLKKDRARWTTAPISEFGIMEMTRQRMRASHESQHFADCPTCRGRGLVQRPDSVMGDALRELAAVLDSDKVHRVEMVVSPRLAGELLSTSRKALSRLERTSGKHVDVRVSEAIQMDRVTFYAYDDRGADLDVSKLGQRKLRDDEMVAYEITADAAEMENWAEEPEAAREPEVEEEAVDPLDSDPHPIELEPVSLSDMSDHPNRPQRGQHRGQHGHGGRGGHGHGQHGDAPAFEGEEGGGRRRRRRGRRGRGGRGRDGQGDEFQQQGNFEQQPGSGDGSYDQPQNEGGPSYDQQESMDDAAYASDQHSSPHPQHGDHPGGNGQMNGAHGGYGGGEGGGGEGGGRRRRRRRRGRGGRGQGGESSGAPNMPHAEHGDGYHPQGQQSYGDDPNAGYAEQNTGEYSEPDAEGPYTEQGGQHAEQPSGEYQEQFGETGDAPHHAPEGDGEGGPRRRRRRRGRGGRAGGGGQGGHDGGQRSGAPARSNPAQSGGGSLAAMFRNDSEPAHDESHEPAAEGEAYVESNAPSDQDGGLAPDTAEQSNDQQTGEERPRRRRGGRGRGRGGNRGGEESSADQESKPARTNEQRSNDRPASPAPQRGTPAAPAKPEPKKVRTLYSSRRKLGPGDMKNVKRED